MVPDKVSIDKAFNIAENPKYDGYQWGLASMIYKVFDKKPSSGAVTRVNKPPTKSEIRQNQRPSDLPRVAKFLNVHKNQQKNYTRQLLENLKVYSLFKDNTWGANLANL